MTEEATPANVRLTDGLGPLPATGYVLAREGDGHSDLRLMSEPAYTEEQMRAYAAEQVAAERERCSVLTDDMLRYAMAALGTGSPKEAERFRAFWLHAMTARNTRA